MYTLALVIDGDNAPLNYTKQIIQFCEVHGTLSTKRAYGDWRQPPLFAHREAMTELGIKRVQQDRIAKNATDFALAMDVASMLDKGAADIYFIVSSDAHFTAVCDRIHQKGAKVVGIGSKSHISSELRKACTLFFDVEEIVENQSKLSANLPSTPDLEPAVTSASEATKPVKPKPMLKMLVRAYQEAPNQDGWVHLPQLRETLIKVDPHFDQRFAGKKLSTWLKGFPEQFEVAGDRIRMK